MKSMTKWTILIIIGAGLLIHFSVVPHLVSMQDWGQYLFPVPSLILYGGYFLAGIGLAGLIQEFRRKQEYRKNIS